MQGEPNDLEIRVQALAQRILELELRLAAAEAKNSLNAQQLGLATQGGGS